MNEFCAELSQNEKARCYVVWEASNLFFRLTPWRTELA